MTRDDIVQLIEDNHRYGEIAADAQIQDCVGAFGGGCIGKPTLSYGVYDTAVSTTFKEIDLSESLTVSRQQSVVVVLLLYPTLATDVTVKYYDPNYIGNYNTVTYASSKVSTDGNPISFSWHVTADTWSESAKFWVKFGASGYFKWQLFKFYYSTGLAEEEEAE